MSVAQVKGADRLQSTLAAAADELAGLGDAQPQVAQALARRAAQAAPRKTGRLAAGHRATSDGASATVANPVRYARPRHNGWKGHRGTPWLADTLAGAAPIAIPIYTATAQDILDTVKGT